MEATQDSLFYFSPETAIWKINRERILQITGARVLLMQIAHPLIAEAVYQHSYVFEKPLLRLHRTLKLTLGLVFGTKAEVQKAVDEIEAAHRPAHGRLNDSVGKHEAGTLYNARNPRQALWVFATLVEGSVFGYEKLVAPLSTTEKDEFLENSAFIAQWMHIPQTMIPKNYEGLLAYVDEAIASQEVCIGESARKIAPFITAQTTPLINWLSLPVIRFNIALLPDTIREQYSYHLADWEINASEQLCKFSRQTLPLLPSILRYVPEYQRAIAAYE